MVDISQENNLKDPILREKGQNGSKQVKKCEKGPKKVKKGQKGQKGSKSQPDLPRAKSGKVGHDWASLGMTTLMCHALPLMVLHHHAKYYQKCPSGSEDIPI